MRAITHLNTIIVAATIALALTNGCKPGERRLPRDSAQAAALRAQGKAPPLLVSPALERALKRRGITVEYRWVAVDSAPRPKRAVPHIDPWSGDTLFLDDTAFLDLRGVSSAEVRRQGDGALVILLLTDSAAERTLIATDAHMGQRVGVLLNGELVSVATISNPLTVMIPLITDIPYPQAMDIGRRIMGARDTSVIKR